MKAELPPQYDPKAVESGIYKKWLDARAFHAVPEAGPRETWKKQPYSIVIPPPNVTGALHLGHAINGTIQDILTRYHRMKGDNTLWMPGIDHAGIATQAVVEKTIFEKEHKSRHDLGREELVRRIWEWKEQFGTRILNQLQSIGSSCDWDRTRFTLDDICARAVREAFFKMFKDGLIFRGKRLVNWDTHLQTAVADDEIYHEAVKGQMTSIRYPVAESENAECEMRNAENADPSAFSIPHSAFLVVATTRPETMLGDTAVAVHPDDPRYKHLVGKHVIVPLVGRRIPIIADGQLVDPKFGTGVVKVTPAHDPNDYATGVRHNLEQINLLTPDGKVNENGAGEFLGKKYSYTGLKFATAARKQVLEDLETLGLIADNKPHEHEVGHSDRSKTPIEPYLSDQWFVRMGDITDSQPTEPRPSGSDQPAAEQPKSAHSVAAGYFISFHTYATWLHGQEPGSVDPDHNVPGTDFVEPRAELLELKFKNATQPPLVLTVEQRQSVLSTLQEVAQHRGWTLHAANVRTTHVHVVVSGPHSPERMMNDFKSYATRRMREAGLITDEGKVWSRHGSTPYLWKASDIAGAVDYVLHRQGENTPGTNHDKSGHVPSGSRQSEPRPSGSDQSTARAQGSLPDGRGSVSHNSSGITLADGTRAPGLAQAAMDAVTSGRVKITPERYAKGYLDWLGQKRDWCISRQLWWGHRIPVWHRRLNIRPQNRLELIGQGELEFLDAGDPVFNWMSGDGVVEETHEVATAVFKHVATGRMFKLDDTKGPPHHGMSWINGEISGEFDVYVCVNHAAPRMEERLQRLGYTQDPDVLDTWFSSALWPISTMGWPADGTSDKPDDQLLPYFYPTSLLSTAREILTLWVARMVMFGLYCKGDVPFKDVYIHAIIQDGEGRPMKKTLGNGVDPVDIVKSHGADALRFTLASMATETQDIRLPVQLVCPHCHERLPNNVNGPVVIGCPHCKKKMTRPVQTAVATDEAPMSHSTSDKFDLGRNFANKIWNASRFILSNISGAGGTPDGNPGLGASSGEQAQSNAKPPHFHAGFRATNLEDRWILSRLNATIQAAGAHINGYRFAELADALRTFFWTDLCDWYLEIAKARIKSGDAAVQEILLHCLRTTLKLLHPVMPFITEELWSYLPTGTPDGNPEASTVLLVTAPWPTFDASALDAAATEHMALIQSVTSAIREIINSYPAARGKPVTLLPRDAATRELLEKSRGIIEPLAGITIAENSLTAAKPENAATRVLPEAQIFIGGVIDKSSEIAKHNKRREEILKLKPGVEAKLANEAFTSKAPAKIVQGLRDQLAKLNEELAAIEQNLKELAG